MAPTQLKSVHTHSLTHLLNHLGISLLVTTYQAKKLIAVRSEGSVVNTHFRVFEKPMGMTANATKIALGSGSAIWEFFNVPRAAAALTPEGKHDGCFVPRNIHVTGDIDIHEMGWDAHDTLWFINTRFSCLCTADAEHSFVPRWKPPFISAYDMTDRCHLNGLAMRDGMPRYVTALGESNMPTGWREHKASGGILMDITTDRIICRGLSMPHSPRWYKNRLWLLESGRGGFCSIDETSGEVTTVCTLPGFTRGIDFYDDYAFIGLSKVRETAVFGGIPLTQQISERISGVWVVQINTGKIVAFLQFESGVEEVFSVAVVPGVRFPEIAEWQMPFIHNTFVLPDDAVKDVSHEHKDMEHAVTYFDAGNTLFNKGDKHAAIVQYRRCLEIQPDYLPAHFNLGVALGDLGSFKEAQEHLLTVIKNDIGHAEAYHSLGFVYAQQGNKEAADAMLEKARRLQQ